MPKAGLVGMNHGFPGSCPSTNGLNLGGVTCCHAIKFCRQMCHIVGFGAPLTTHSVEINSVLGSLGRWPILLVVTHMHQPENSWDAWAAGLCHQISHLQPLFFTTIAFSTIIPRDPDHKHIKGSKSVNWGSSWTAEDLMLDNKIL